MRFGRTAFSTLVILSGLGGLARAEDPVVALQAPAWSLSGDMGLMNITANELVYGGGGKRVSQLVWKSGGVQVIGGVLRVDLDQDWWVSARGRIGVNGDGRMADYDWLRPFAPGPRNDQWSDRSLHPDTRLNHYVELGLELRRDLLESDATMAGLGAGFAYTDVKWTAWGGSYIYSIKGFRDSRGTFADRSKGISYRQILPAPYLGVHASHRIGDLTLSGVLNGGLAIGAGGQDDHWARSLRFNDHFDTAPTLSLEASADYAINPSASLYLSGSFDRMFRVKADTTMIDRLTGGRAIFRNGAGADFQSAAITFGIRGRF